MAFVLQLLPQSDNLAVLLADGLVGGQVTGKYSPLEVAQWLADLADAVATNIATARELLGQAASAPAFRRVEEDVLIQRGLALFFAGKLRSAVLWRLFVLTGNQAAGEMAIASYTEGRDHWAKMASRAKGVYRSNITYGGSRALRGHWIDRLPAFDEDIADLRQRLVQRTAPATKLDSAVAARMLKRVAARPVRPVVAVRHTPAAEFHAGQALAVTLDCRASALVGVRLYYRHVNQAERWQSVELARRSDAFQGEIPAAYTARRYALQYYFEVQASATEVTLFPPLADDLANVPYYVVRRAG